MTDWSQYERCPVCARTWQCVRVTSSWSGGVNAVALKNPHPKRKKKRK